MIAMKRFQTEYSESSVAYRPFYEAGKIGIISLVVLDALFIATAVWTLVDNPSREMCLVIPIVILIAVCVLCIVFRYIYRAMHEKIIVSNTGIVYFRNNVAVEKQIEWEDVESVYFAQDSWYGRKSFRIFLKKISFQSPRKIDKCDFVIPVNSVDEQKLLQLIPKGLWANNPWRI